MQMGEQLFCQYSILWGKAALRRMEEYQVTQNAIAQWGISHQRCKGRLGSVRGCSGGQTQGTVSCVSLRNPDSRLPSFQFEHVLSLSVELTECNKLSRCSSSNLVIRSVS